MVLHHLDRVVHCIFTLGGPEFIHKGENRAVLEVLQISLNGLAYNTC